MFDTSSSNRWVVYEGIDVAADISAVDRGCGFGAAVVWDEIPAIGRAGGIAAILEQQAKVMYELGLDAGAGCEDPMFQFRTTSQAARRESA